MSYKTRSLLVLTFVGLLLISGCDNASGPNKADDAISIKSVTPESGLIADTETEFVVIIDYELASADSGELNIGFNSVEAGRYLLKNEAKTLIVKGAGEHQFNVSVVTKDWGNEGDFAVYVNLSEYPHGYSWTPLASDIRVLTF